MHVFADVIWRKNNGKRRETMVLGSKYILYYIYIYIIYLNRENVKDGLSFQTRMVQAPFGTNYIYN